MVGCRFLLVCLIACFLLSTVSASVLCSYKGPENSEDLLRLSNFVVEGPSNLELGDEVTVSFDLKNFGQTPVNLTDKGVFTAVRYKETSNKDFGFTSEEETLSPTQTVHFSDSFELDKRGMWDLWPSYEFWKRTYSQPLQAYIYLRKKGPDFWHGCELEVCPDYCENGVRYYDAYIGQNNDCVYKHENCPQGCDKNGVDCSSGLDSDKDGIPDEEDNCPLISNSNQKDVDNDNVGDVCDNCPSVTNRDQHDSNKNGVGDACELDAPPTVTVSHIPLSVDSNINVTFTARARDNANMTNISIYINGMVVKQCQRSTLVQRTDLSGKYWECVYVGGSYPAGRLTYFALAYDGSGNMGSSGEKTLNVTLAVSMPPVVVTGCFSSIRGSIRNFTYDGNTLGVGLCEAIMLSGGSPSGGMYYMPIPGVGWVCKTNTTRYGTLTLHLSFEFDRLCAGDYLVNPYPKEVSEGECQWRGMFWDLNMTTGGSRLLNVPNESVADFVFVSDDSKKPEINISISPNNATTRDTIQLIANAIDESGVKEMRMNGWAAKLITLRGHCTTDTYEGHEVTICEEIDYWTNETFSKNCSTSPCVYTIPANSTEFDKYLIYAEVRAIDNVCNWDRVVKEFDIRKPSPLFPRRNVRNPSAYREKEVFMVPDNDWRTVLSLTPIAIGKTCTQSRSYYGDCSEIQNWVPPRPSEECCNPEYINYPLLIVHVENLTGSYRGGFDLDSAMLFMYKYKPERVTVFTGGERLRDDFDDYLYLWLINPKVMNERYGCGLNCNIAWDGVHTDPLIRLFNASNTSALYKRYFSEINSVIVAEDDYTVGLRAAVLAARTNMPLYFDGHFKVEDIENKSVHIAGNLRPSSMDLIRAKAKEIGYMINRGETVYSPYSLEDLYLSGVDILVSPYDLNTSSTECWDNLNFSTGQGFTVRAFGRNSLAAPVLAAAREGNIIFSPYTGMYCDDHICGNGDYGEYEYMHRNLKNIIDDIKNGIGPVEHKIIVADPYHIPDSYHTSCADDKWQYRRQVDREYGADGRIYGITVTDTSAYIARDLFYDDIVGEQPTVRGMVIAHSIGSFESDAQNILRDLEHRPGYDLLCYTGSHKDGCIMNSAPPTIRYTNKSFIIFGDHGGPVDWDGTLASWDIPNVWSNETLDLPVVFGSACLTNNIWQGGVDTMGPNWIRKGAIAYHGSVGVSYGPDCWSDYSYKTNIRRFMEDSRSPDPATGREKSIGQVSRDLSSCVSQCCKAGVCWLNDCSYHDNDILLGDPYLVPNIIPDGGGG